jgi:hypothetical protein
MVRRNCIKKSLIISEELLYHLTRDCNRGELYGNSQTQFPNVNDINCLIRIVRKRTDGGELAVVGVTGSVPAVDRLPCQGVDNIRGMVHLSTLILKRN